VRFRQQQGLDLRLHGIAHVLADGLPFGFAPGPAELASVTFVLRIGFVRRGRGPGGIPGQEAARRMPPMEFYVVATGRSPPCDVMEFGY
jgi:hypothetical protein